MTTAAEDSDQALEKLAAALLTLKKKAGSDPAALLYGYGYTRK